VLKGKRGVFRPTEYTRNPRLNHGLAERFDVACNRPSHVICLGDSPERRPAKLPVQSVVRACLQIRNSTLDNNMDSRKATIVKYAFLAVIALLIFSGIDCRKNPVGPPSVADTTSSNFTWTVDTIGAAGSYLYDVDIVNDSLAYAVGLIMPSDSIGRNNTIYWDNAAVWNGTKWTPIQIPYYYQGQRTFVTLHSVFARNVNDIWFDFLHWDGKEYSQPAPIPWFQSEANKVWESSDGRQVYIVGGSGIIAYSPDMVAHGSKCRQAPLCSSRTSGEMEDRCWLWRLINLALEDSI